MLNKCSTLVLAVVALFSLNAHAYFNDFQAPQNTCLMGSNGGGTGTASYRAIVGADLPALSTMSGSVLAAGMLALPSADVYVGTAGNVPAAVALSGGATINNTGVVTLGNTAVTGQAITGFTAGAGVVAATDTILQAFQKIVGNISAIVTPSFVTKTTTYTAVSGNVVLSNATGGAFTVTLPAASSNAGAEITVKKIDSSANAVTIGVTGGDTIDGLSTIILPTQWDVGVVGSNGTVWYVIN